jgi:pilus assembly protein Flp/PilA
MFLSKRFLFHSSTTHVAATRKRVWTMKAVRRFLRGEEGPTAVEYAVMLALIVVTCLGAINTLVQRTQESYNYSSSEISNAITTASS